MQAVPEDVHLGVRAVRAIPGAEIGLLLKDSLVRTSDPHVQHMTRVWRPALPAASVIGNS